VYLQAIKKGGG